MLRVCADNHLTQGQFNVGANNWALEHTSYQKEIAEKALAHVVGDETERAYLRSDVFSKRRRMMQMWADFCGRDRAAVKYKVVPIRAA